MGVIKRIISKLEIKGENLVKGIHFEGLRALGSPEEFALQYYQDGIDEIIYLDVVASLYGRNSLKEVIRRVSSKIFVPMTVGGGIRTLDDIRDVLAAGADKVAINTEAIRNPELIREASQRFGSQCIVVSIASRETSPGRYQAFTDNGREHTGIDVLDWVVEAERLGAGEILLTSIDKDGTGKGLDVKLTAKVSQMTSIPVIASGGVGDVKHIAEGFEKGNADAVCISTFLHYNYLKLIVPNITMMSKQDGNTEFLENFHSHGKNDKSFVDIGTIKQEIINYGFPCRTI